MPNRTPSKVKFPPLAPCLAYLDRPTDAVWKSTSNEVLTHRPEYLLNIVSSQSGAGVLQTPWARGCNVFFTAEPDVIELFEYMINVRMEVVKAVDRLSLHTSGNTADNPIQLIDQSSMELTDDRHRSLALLFHRIIASTVRMFASTGFQPPTASPASVPFPPSAPGSRHQPYPLPIRHLGSAFLHLLTNRKRMLFGEDVTIDQGIPVAPQVVTTRHLPLSRKNLSDYIRSIVGGIPPLNVIERAKTVIHGVSPDIRWVSRLAALKHQSEAADKARHCVQEKFAWFVQCLDLNRYTTSEELEQFSTHGQTFRGLLQTLALEVCVLNSSMTSFVKLLELKLKSSPGKTLLRHNIDTVADVLSELIHIPSACSEWLTQVNDALSLAPNFSIKLGSVKLEDALDHQLNQVRSSGGGFSLLGVVNLPNAPPSESLNTPQSTPLQLPKKPPARKAKAHSLQKSPTHVKDPVSSSLPYCETCLTLRIKSPPPHNIPAAVRSPEPVLCSQNFVPPTSSRAYHSTVDLDLTGRLVYLQAHDDQRPFDSPTPSNGISNTSRPSRLPAPVLAPNPLVGTHLTSRYLSSRSQAAPSSSSPLPRRPTTCFPYSPTFISETLSERMEYEHSMILSIAMLPGYVAIAQAWYHFSCATQKCVVRVVRFMELIDAVLHFRVRPSQPSNSPQLDEWNRLFCQKMWRDIRNEVDSFDTEDVMAVVSYQRSASRPHQEPNQFLYRWRAHCDRYISRTWRAPYDRAIGAIATKLNLPGPIPELFPPAASFNV